MNNGLSLVSHESLSSWGIDSDGIAYVSGMIPGDILMQPEESITVDTVATLMVYSVFGSVLAETDVIRSEEGIFGRYARTLISRIEKSTDTGIAHKDVLPMWDFLTPREKHDIAPCVIDACDELENFPDVGNMNVAYTMKDAVIDAEDVHVPACVPAVVSTPSGLCVIVPSIRGVTPYESAFAHLAYPYNSGISQVHVWDIAGKKVRKVSADDFLVHVKESKEELLQNSL